MLEKLFINFPKEGNLKNFKKLLEVLSKQEQEELVSNLLKIDIVIKKRVLDWIKDEAPHDDARFLLPHIS